MKILFVHNYYQQRGGEDVVFEAEAQLLEQAGHDVHQVIFDNRSIAEDLSMWASGKLAVSTIWSNESASILRHAIKQFSPDVAHFHNTFPLVSLSGYRACRVAGIPVVQTLHNYRLLCSNAQFFRDSEVCEDCLNKITTWRGIVHRCYRGSATMSAMMTTLQTAGWALNSWNNDVTRYIALTDFARKKYVQGGIDNRKIDVKPNFLAPDPGAGPGGGGYCLFVGRLSVEKGVDTLLRAWDEIDDSIQLYIVGDGPMSSVVEQAALNNSNVHWLGTKKLDDVLHLMKHAELLIFPSQWYEGMPRTIIESLAVGTPVLASNIGGLPEMIETGRNGNLFRPGDHLDLAREVHGMFEQLETADRYRSSARELFLTRFSGSANYQQLMSVYERAISGAHPK
jgi:glycosyltransferase involved in cell wall biosynthesis